jgi:hypothetical protein
MTNLLMKLFRINQVIILSNIIFGKKIIFDNIIMATQASITAVANAETGKLEFTIVPYQEGATWDSSDVKSPEIVISTSNPYKEVEKLLLPVYTDAADGTVGKIVSNKISSGVLAANVTYYFTFYCKNGSLSPLTIGEGSKELPPPTGPPVLGEGTWSSPNLTVKMTLDERIESLLATFTNKKADNTTQTLKIHVAGTTALDTIRTNGSYAFNLGAATGWTKPAKGEDVTLKFIVSNGVDNSDPVVKEYSLYEKPDAPLDIKVNDVQNTTTIGVTDTVVDTQNLLNAVVTVEATQVFTYIEIVTTDEKDEFTTIVKTVLYDAKVTDGIYKDISISVELGSVAKYAARVVAPVDGVAEVRSDLKETGFVIDRFNDPKPVLKAERLSSGHDIGHPAAQYDLFEITLEAGPSSYDKRYISNLQINIIDQSDAAGWGYVASANRPDNYEAPDNGAWDVDSNGSAKFRVYNDILAQGAVAQFQIIIGGVRGFYTYTQHLLAGAGDAPSDVQYLNVAVIVSNIISIEYPLVAPQAPLNLSMTAFDAGVMVRWENNPAPNNVGNSNNKADGFLVNLYTKKGFEVGKTIPAAEFDTGDSGSEFAILNGLVNDQAYWANVQAYNKSADGTVVNYSSDVRSLTSATPLDSLLGQLLTLKSKSFTDPSCTFVVDMAASNVEIASITVQEIDANGVDIDNKVVTTINSKQATTKTIIFDPSGNLYDTKYFAIYATASSSGTGPNTPFIFTSIVTGSKPTIGNMEFTKNTSHTGKKTTLVKVPINNHYSDLTLADLIAIPEQQEEPYTGKLVFQLTKPIDASPINSSVSLTNFYYSVTLDYHIANDGSGTSGEMAVVLAANGIGRAQKNN